MITEEVKLRNTTAVIDETAMNLIKAYIKGAVYCWCKNCKDETGEPLWFAARDLFGGENYYWQGTPLKCIYDWHEQDGANDPVTMAGRDVGHILKRILHDDENRSFNTSPGYRRIYQWTGGNRAE